MFSSLFSRLGQSLGGKEFAASALAQYFGKPLGKGLSSKIGDYVANGLNSSALSDVSDPSVQQKWRNRARVYPPRDEYGLFSNL